MYVWGEKEKEFDLLASLFSILSFLYKQIKILLKEVPFISFIKGRSKEKK